MKPRISSLDGVTRLIADGGASSTAQENTVEAFQLAVTLGASGIRSTAWLSADGQALLAGTGSIGGRLRRRRIGSVDRVGLPDHIPSIDDLYDLVGTTIDVSIGVGDRAALDTVVGAARRAGDEAEQRLWVTSPSIDTLTEWRRSTSAKLILSTTLGPGSGGQERLAAQLRERGIDGLELPHRDWNGGLIALLHRFERYCLAAGLEHEREMAKLIDVGIDGIASRHVDRMVAVLAQFSET